MIEKTYSVSAYLMETIFLLIARNNIDFAERSIVELNVSEVSANLTSRPYDTSVSFAVQSLLIGDAMQTFGPDFELLVASHKNLW